MNQRFRLEPDASAELDDAALWYEQKRPGMGVEFVHAVGAALDQIARGQRSASVSWVFRTTFLRGVGQ